MDSTQIIIVPYGLKKKLRKDFKVSYPTIASALTGVTKTKLADALRAAALQRGGTIATKPRLITN